VAVLGASLVGAAIFNGHAVASPGPGESLEVEAGTDEKTYAHDFGVTVEEATRRFEVIEVARELQADLRDSQEEHFGGLWISHEPFEVVVNVVPGGEAAATTSVESLGLEGSVRIQQARFTETFLTAQQGKLPRVMPDDLDYGTGIDIRAGYVKLWAVRPADRPRLETLELPQAVKIVEGYIAEPAVNIYGGLLVVGSVHACTSGFSVEEIGSSRTGIVTAGHCDNDLGYNGQGLPWQYGQQWGPYDVQWHTTPGLTDVNKVQDGPSTTRRVTSVQVRGNMMVGDVVCKYGQTTGYDCGTIDDLSVSGCVPDSEDYPLYIYVNNNDGDLADGGDSGGPVYKGAPAKAWGIITCDAKGFFGEDSGDMVFMAQNVGLPLLDVKVMTS
jgi:hypothetical protein